MSIDQQKYRPVTDGFEAAQFSPAFQDAMLSDWTRTSGVAGLQHLGLWTL